MEGSTEIHQIGTLFCLNTSTSYDIIFKQYLFLLDQDHFIDR